MKRILILLSFVMSISLCYGQYSKEKLTGILTGGSSKAWMVKASNAARPEKSYTFNENFTVAIAKAEGAAQNEKWALSSADNIRWFITIGSQKYEMIVSYDKGGTQYVKLTNQSGDKSSLYNETLLYPVK